ncbi:MAG: helix-turn-helix transcriptional regulator [Paracoccaceae bacterium]|nr:helix-turn-helix transcriptional regulator [Paracoccaceae bacterium]
MMHPSSPYLTTKELAQLLRLGERKVYDLASSEQIPCLRAGGKLLFERSAVEAWLKQSHTGPNLEAALNLPAIIAGSHDPLLDWALRQSGSGLAGYFDGSEDGLTRVRGKKAALCALHIYEEKGWNTNRVSAEFNDLPVVLVEFCKRERGLIASQGNPLGIKGLDDIKRRRLARRQEGAAGQKLFEYLLSDAGVNADMAFAGQSIARSESDLALEVKSGRAEAAFGLKSEAVAQNLDFIPIMTERLDLLVWRKAWFDTAFQKFINFCEGDIFKDQAKSLSGYDLSDFGNIHFNASH